MHRLHQDLFGLRPQLLAAATERGAERLTRINARGAPSVGAPIDLPLLHLLPRRGRMFKRLPGIENFLASIGLGLSGDAVGVRRPGRADLGGRQATGLVEVGIVETAR